MSSSSALSRRVEDLGRAVVRVAMALRGQGRGHGPALRKDSSRGAGAGPGATSAQDPQASFFTSASTPSKSLNLTSFGLAETGRVTSVRGPFTLTRNRATWSLPRSTVTGTYIMKPSGTSSCLTRSITWNWPSLPAWVREETRQGGLAAPAGHMAQSHLTTVDA